MTYAVPHRASKTRKTAVEVCRILLALTFVFSGFVKTVDPWGTGIKVGEYLAAFDMDFIYGWRFGIGIWLNGAEMMLGLMVLFKVRLRLTTIFISFAMLFFTILSLVLAIWNPVDDCGCFGEAIKLTNWETFIKNMILLPMAWFVCWNSRKLPMIPTWSDGFFMLLFGSIAFGIGVYSYRHLPIIDFLPYKVGTNLVEAMEDDGHDDVETILIYKDRKTGKRQEFDLSDTTWYDDSRWEYVDTKVMAVNNKVHASVRDFAVFDAENDITEEILSDTNVVYMVFAGELGDIRSRCERKLSEAVSQARERGYRVMCITADPVDINPDVTLVRDQVPCYNMDGTTIKTVLRARTGVVVLRNGVIIDKVNCRDMLEKGVLPDYRSQ